MVKVQGNESLENQPDNEYIKELNARKAELLGMAQYYTEMPLQDSDMQEIRLKNEQQIQGIKDFLDKDNISTLDFDSELRELAFVLNVKKNLERGIVVQERILDDGSKALIRDARRVDKNPEKLREDRPEKYAIQMVAAVRGAIELLESESLSKNEEEAGVTEEARQNAIEQLKFLTSSSMKELDGLNKSSIKNKNTIILSILKEAGIKKPSKKLLFAREMAGLSTDHYHVLSLGETTPDDKGDTIITCETEIRLDPLSENERRQYQEVANLYRDGKLPITRESLLEAGIENLEWFASLEPYKQESIGSRAQGIADGKKMIPSQSLKVAEGAPGLRNYYQRIVSIGGKRGDWEFDITEPLSEDFYSGAPIAEGEKSKETTQENFEAHKKYLPEGAKVNVNILNTKGKEGYIFSTMDQATAEENDVSYSATPVNAGRILPGAGWESGSLKNNLKIIADGLKVSDEYEIDKIQNYLKDGRENIISLNVKKLFGYPSLEEKAMEQIDVIAQSNKELAYDLKLAVSTRTQMDVSYMEHYYQNTRGGKNTGVDIAANMLALKNSVKLENGVLHKSMDQKAIENYPFNLDGCKSCKDRGGLEKLKSAVVVICKKILIPVQGEEGKKLLSDIAAVFHIQDLAGMNAGTLGCDGVKTKKGGVINSYFMAEEDENIHGVVDARSAEFNGEIKVNKENLLSVTKKRDRIFADFKRDMQEAVEIKTQEKTEERNEIRTVSPEVKREVKAIIEKGERIIVREPSSKEQQATEMSTGYSPGPSPSREDNNRKELGR